MTGHVNISRGHKPVIAAQKMLYNQWFAAPDSRLIWFNGPGFKVQCISGSKSSHFLKLHGFFEDCRKEFKLAYPHFYPQY
ncbi:MAG: hypothetical protein M3O26_07585 [Pseudomonadota bacterium]|nr:hypothetical protein [Pseudomonadota bacterium]